MAFYNIRALEKLNLKLLLDYEFIRDGYFTNVSSGQQFHDGSDMSLLLEDTNADDLLFGVENGQIYQSAFRNWVYESGVILNDVIHVRDLSLPILASGVYVNGLFKPTNTTHPEYDSTFAHSIDYINGRVIFDDPHPGATVHADFSYKHIRVGFEDEFNNQFDDGFLESKYTTNPLTSNQLIYPSGTAYPWPAVFIEVDRRRYEPYEIGHRGNQSIDEIICHVWALDSMTRDNIVDVICGQNRKTIPMVDFNVAPLPLSGITNTLSPEYIAYQNLLKNPVVGVPGKEGVSSRTIGFTWELFDIDPRNLPKIEEFVRSEIRMQSKIWLIMPTSPLGFNFGADQFRSGTENF